MDGVNYKKELAIFIYYNIPEKNYIIIYIIPRMFEI